MVVRRQRKPQDRSPISGVLSHHRGNRIQHQIGEAQHLVIGGTVPSEERPYPGQELGEGKGVDQIVIGAGIEIRPPVGRVLK
jgi:hypothetical protein